MTEDLFSDERSHEGHAGPGAARGERTAPAEMLPLAARSRPSGLAELHGQEHLLGPGKPLRAALEEGKLHSMVLWGPPGVGKTTIARLLACRGEAEFLQLSAVLAGIKEIRGAIDHARAARSTGRRTILFIDEAHRFNKSQQDAFLPHVEDGTVIFVGATTENPSFELNAALLSRARVYRLRALSPSALCALMEDALGKLVPKPVCAAALLERIAVAADGDGRRALNLLQLALDLAEPATPGSPPMLSDALLDEVLAASLQRRFDRGGDQFYDQISALHKAVRGSAPDAALYWLCRMIDGGCDPRYLARRIIRMASEDIGNADPRALTLCLDAWQVQERLGQPEGELALAQAVTYLACAPKSNAVYRAFKAAMATVQGRGSDEVPLHLRNAPTRLMNELGHGSDYRYAHDEPGAYAAGESYLPEALSREVFYEPVDRGLESRIRERLRELRALDAASLQQRWGGPKPDA